MIHGTESIRHFASFFTGTYFYAKTYDLRFFKLQQIYPWLFQRISPHTEKVIISGASHGPCIILLHQISAAEG